MSFKTASGGPPSGAPNDAPRSPDLVTLGGCARRILPWLRPAGRALLGLRARDTRLCAGNPDAGRRQESPCLLPQVRSALPGGTRQPGQSDFGDRLLLGTHPSLRAGISAGRKRRDSLRPPSPCCGRHPHAHAGLLRPLHAQPHRLRERFLRPRVPIRARRDALCAGYVSRASACETVNLRVIRSGWGLAQSKPSEPWAQRDLASKLPDRVGSRPGGPLKLETGGPQSPTRSACGATNDDRQPGGADGEEA